MFTRSRLFVGYSLLIFLWTYTILSLGIQPASEQDISGIINTILANDFIKSLIPELEFYYGGSKVSTNDPVRFLNFMFRKAAHFFAYGFLSLLIVRQQLLRGVSYLRSYLTALITIALVASLDEYIQSLIPGRSGMIEDVILDISGSVLSLIWIGFLVSRDRKKDLDCIKY